MTLTGHTSAADLPLPVASPTVTRLLPRVVGSAGPPVIVAVATFVVFLPSLWNGFVNWDDTTNFLNNPDYRGLGWKNLRWMATTFLLGQWIPLTWLTLGADYTVWGMNPLGYHLTNVLLHCAAAVAWYFVVRRLLVLCLPAAGSWALAAGASAAALFFAIHPLRAESVAWITERRDVLSGLFFLLALLAYLNAQERNRRRLWLAVSIGLYLLAALSKSMVVSLPVVLLLLDVYPLGRLDRRPWSWRAAISLVVEKIPYFVIALATGLMAIWAQRWNNYLTPLDRLPLPDRIPLALYSSWFYLVKTIAPTGLSPLYELPAKVDIRQPWLLAAVIGSLGLSAAAVALGRRHVGVAVAWAAYLVMLAPVSNLVHNGHQLANDRYSYLPCLPWAMLFGLGLAWVIADRGQHGLRRSISSLAVGAAVIWIAALGILAVQQVQVWRDDDTLWRYAIDADPNCSVCRVNLGVALGNQGFAALAAAEFERALALRPDRVRTRSNLGVALMHLGRLDAALVEFDAVLARHPDDLTTRNNRAVCLLRLGRRAQAIGELRGILGRDPRNVLARSNLGVALVEDRRLEEGISVLEGVIRDKPDQVQARAGLVLGYLAIDRPEQARQTLEELRAIDSRAALALEGLFVATW